VAVVNARVKWPTDYSGASATPEGKMVAHGGGLAMIGRAPGLVNNQLALLFSLKFFSVSVFC
jgi:hypothetical protein